MERPSESAALRQIAGAGAVLAGVAGRSGSSFGASLGITDFLKLARGQNAVALLDSGGQAGGVLGNVAHRSSSPATVGPIDPGIVRDDPPRGHVEATPLGAALLAAGPPASRAVLRR
jgi:hypothetical protein